MSNLLSKNFIINLIYHTFILLKVIVSLQTPRKTLKYLTPK